MRNLIFLCEGEPTETGEGVATLSLATLGILMWMVFFRTVCDGCPTSTLALRTLIAAFEFACVCCVHVRFVLCVIVGRVEVLILPSPFEFTVVNLLGG